MSVTPVIIDNLPTLTINGLNPATTIDGVNDLIPIYTASATATQGINRQTLLGVTGQPADINSTQTLTNKTITAPTISAPTLSGTVLGTYTLGGTPTFPATVLTTTGTQTVTNKTINFSNNTISNVSGGNLTALSVTATQIANNTITATQIASGGIDYANLLSTIFSGQIVSYANTGTAGGYIYYLNMGGFKVYFGYSGNTVTCAGNTGTSVTWVTKGETANIVGGSAAGAPTGNLFVTSSVDRGNPTITQNILNLSAAGSGGGVAGYAGFWFMAIGY